MVLANGLDYPLYPVFREPAATVLPRKEGPRHHGSVLGRSIWRQLSAITVKRRVERRQLSGPLALKNLGDDRGATLWIGALATDKAKIEDVVEASYDVPAGMFRDTGRKLYEEGEGPMPAPLMLVGEQPGDQEDRAGNVFVGPAGRVLDEALAEAGIPRQSVYITNAVKHFKWKPAPRGKRRLHQRPNHAETVACRQWLVAEVAMVKPGLIVCLGAVAAESLIGPGWRIGEHHGEVTESVAGIPATATFHPSAVLRAPDPEQRRAVLAQLVSDLQGALARSR